MKSHHLPVSVPGTVLAQLLGLTPRRIRGLADEGIIKKAGRRGHYRLAESVQGYLAMTRNMTESAGLTAARTRLIEERATIATLDRRERAGELVSRADADAALAHICSVTQRRMRAVASNVAPRAAQRPAKEVAQIVLASIDAALLAVSNARLSLNCSRATCVDRGICAGHRGVWSARSCRRPDSCTPRANA